MLPVPATLPVPFLREILTRIDVDPEPYRKAGWIPFFASLPQANERNQAPVATRMAPTFWGMLPGDAYDQDLRALFHDLFKRLQPDRYLRFLAFENHALAGFDLYDEVLRGRDLEPQASEEKTRPRATVIAIDGIDGAGKSSQLQSLKEYLEGKGKSCVVHKIYRHGVFHDTVTDMTRRCAGDSNLHLWRLQRVAKLFDSIKYFYSTVQADLASHDVVLFDRYLDTHYAAGLGRYHHDPYARELLSVFPDADRIYLLDLEVSTALERIAKRPTRTVDENPYMLAQYRQALLAIANERGSPVLESNRDPSAIRDWIRNDVDALLAERQA